MDRGARPAYNRRVRNHAPYACVSTLPAAKDAVGRVLALLCLGAVWSGFSAGPAAAQTHVVQPLPRVAHPYDPSPMNVGGAAQIALEPDAYRRPYDQYASGWSEPPPQIASVYAPPGQPVVGQPATAPAPAQVLPPLAERQVGVAPTPPAAPAGTAPQLTPMPMQLAQQAAQSSAAAASAPPEEGLRYGRGSQYGVSELRFGILAHNKGPIASATENGAQVNMEARFRSPDIFKIILEPRPTVGASINTAGDTSFFYAGLTWGGFVWKGFFVEGFFGMAVHDGWLESNDPDPPRRLMGSRVVFREALEVGYRFLENHSVSFMIDHYSNAGWLADRNQGNDDFGLRYGYKF